MSDSIIVYNQPTQKLVSLPFTQVQADPVDLTTIGLDKAVVLTDYLTDTTFALVYDGTTWHSQDYMAWEDLRINEALAQVKDAYQPGTQAILTRFVAGMDIKYQGQKSWVALLNELAQDIEGRA